MTDYVADAPAYPCDLDAETALLGAMLVRSDATLAGLDGCVAADFHHPMHGRVFEAIAALVARGEPADPVTVAAELGRHGQPITDQAVLIGWVRETPSLANAATYAAIVAGFSRRRRLMDAALDLSAAAFDGDMDRVAGIVRSVEDDVSGRSGVDGLGVRPLAELIATVDGSPAPRYLVRSVIAEGDYGVLAAEPKAGKTFGAADLTVSVASGTPWLGIFEVDVRGPVLVFAGEGGDRKIVRRLRAICASRGVDPTTLPVRVCARVPHLADDRAVQMVGDEIAEHGPVLVIVDPLYLAARGARASDLIDMGAHLERVQHVCQRHGSALLIVHHWNKTGDGKGAKRMSGAGPEAWGRFLVSAAVVSQRTDPVTSGSDVVLDLSFVGDEIAEQTVRVRRRVWTDDVDDLGSAMHYEVGPVAVAAEPTDPELTGLRPADLRVLTVLRAPVCPAAGLSVGAIGDVLANDGDGPPLKARTIYAALAALREAGLAVTDGGLSRPSRALRLVEEGADGA